MDSNAKKEKKKRGPYMAYLTQPSIKVPKTTLRGWKIKNPSSSGSVIVDVEQDQDEDILETATNSSHVEDEKVDEVVIDKIVNLENASSFSNYNTKEENIEAFPHTFPYYTASNAAHNEDDVNNGVCVENVSTGDRGSPHHDLKIDSLTFDGYVKFYFLLHTLFC